jgi:hypothetical protein
MRVKVFEKVALLVIALAFTAEANAQIGSVSAGTDRYGTFYAFSARSIGKTNFFMFQNIKYFSGTADRFNGSATTSESVSDFGLQLGFNLGISSESDIVFSGNFLQTPNRAPSIPKDRILALSESLDIPDDFYLNVRYLPFSWSKNRINMGFMTSLKFEGNGFPNAPFQVYSSGKTEAGFAVLTSYFQKADVPETGFSMHLNLQYWNHLDNGEYLNYYGINNVSGSGPNGPSLVDTAISQHNTSSFRYALGLSYPFIVGEDYLYVVADVYGQMFLAKPAPAAYSRQNFAYAALGVKYQLMDWLAIHLGGEFQILKSTVEKTVSSVATGIEDLTVSGSDYPSWRLIAGVTMPLSPRAATYQPVVQTVTEVQREDRKKKEVESILYSEQEIQKRSVNFQPVRQLRSNYKDAVNEYLKV